MNGGGGCGGGSESCRIRSARGRRVSGTGKEVDLYPADFNLLAGENSAVLRPVDGDTIAEILTGAGTTSLA